MSSSATTPRLSVELPLLGLLALLWGGSYLFLKIAVAEIPPITLIAIRVSVAAAFLGMIALVRGAAWPRGPGIWTRLLWQAVLNSIAAWTLLAWGQQYVDAGLAAVLNSTAPIFVFFIGLALGTREGAWRLLGASIGLVGIVLIVGTDALSGLGADVWGQLAVLASAVLYAGAALHGRHFNGISPVVTAAGTMIWATVWLVPASLLLEAPWRLSPSPQALGAALTLGVACTGVALMLYFRLVRTLGPMGVASQAYLRAGVGVALGALILGETVPPVIWAGVVTTLAGVALINLAQRR
ncbi:MAG: EamA family transporter [Pseudomonadota bacterium]